MAWRAASSANCLAGGPLPASLDIEFGSLRQEFTANRLSGEFLGALNQAVGILVQAGVHPIFVFEDTEAIVGSAREDREDRVKGFVDGPLNVFQQELDTPCLVAIQPGLVANNASWDRLAAAMAVIEVPHLGGRGVEGLTAMLQRRLELSGINEPLPEVVADEAVEALVEFYGEVHGDLRKTLAAVHDATDNAAGVGSERVLTSHMRVGTANWR